MLARIITISPGITFPKSHARAAQVFFLYMVHTLGTGIVEALFTSQEADRWALSYATLWEKIGLFWLIVGPGFLETVGMRNVLNGNCKNV